MFNRISMYALFSFVPFLTLGILTIALFALSIIPMYYLIFTFISWVLIAGLGVAVGYHRIFSHNTHPNLPCWKENILLFLGTMSGQGPSIIWVAIHRGYHHRYSDTVKDLHSPIHGILYAFFGWTLKITKDNPTINLRFAGPILKKKNHIWFYENDMKVLWLVPIVVALFDWKLSLAMCCLPTALALVQDNLINVLGHKKAYVGYRNFETSDLSQNNLLLGYFAWGQGWHNNHHHDPKSFDFGTGISGKWWEFDPCRIFKPFLRG